MESNSELHLPKPWLEIRLHPRYRSALLLKNRCPINSSLNNTYSDVEKKVLRQRIKNLTQFIFDQVIDKMRESD